MAKHRTYSIEFKRQVAQEYLGGETLHGLVRRHDVSRNLIRIWVSKLEAGAFDEDVEAAGLLQEFEAKISALERLVGRQALEIEFLKGALKSAPRPRSATTSVIAGPVGPQGPPTRGQPPAARRARRPARGSLLWATGTSYRRSPWCNFTPPRRYIFSPPLTLRRRRRSETRRWLLRANAETG